MSELSFVDYLLIAFSLIYSWRVFHTAHPPPAGIKSQPSPPLLAPPAPAEGSDAPILPEADSALGQTLKRIATASRYAGINTFVDGARHAYEIVVEAFAAGELNACSYLLSETVRERFAEVIAQRRRRGETTEFMFIGFRTVAIVDAGLDHDHAWIEVRFVVDMVSVNRDGEGRVVAGVPGKVVSSCQIWTFERDLRAAVPNWLLVATEDDDA